MEQKIGPTGFTKPQRGQMTVVDKSNAPHQQGMSIEINAIGRIQESLVPSFDNAGGTPQGEESRATVRSEIVWESLAC